MGALLKLATMLAKYGTKAVKWVWNHSQQILDWINAGQAVETIYEKIKGMLGFH